MFQIVWLPNGSASSESTCRVNARFISSDDGGRTWRDSAKIAVRWWMDYISAVFVDGKPYSACAIAGPLGPKTGRFNEAIYSVRLPGGRD